jgi:hypothetical protein
MELNLEDLVDFGGGGGGKALQKAISIGTTANRILDLKLGLQPVRIGIA